MLDVVVSFIHHAILIAIAFGSLHLAINVGSQLWQSGAPLASHLTAQLTRRTFRASNYKRYYDEANPPRRPQDILATVRTMLRVYGKLIGAPRHRSERLIKALEDELDRGARLDSDGEHLACRLAVRLWTSSATAGFNKEFCSILNEIIRNDIQGPALELAASLARAMNVLLTSSLRGARVRWPTASWKVYRGTGMPRDELEKFTMGLTYRAPMFLATSFKMAKALDFLKCVPDHLLRVLFVFHIDPVLKCRHALLIQAVSACGDEAEFLFAPYSAFTVSESDIEQPRPSKRQRRGVEHLQVHVAVAPDNLCVSEDVAVMDWH